MALEFNIYINNILQGTTSSMSWNIAQIYTAPNEGYYLPMPYETSFTWRVDAHDTETGLTTEGDNWLFTTEVAPEIPEILPENSPVPAEQIWVAEEESWKDSTDYPELYFAGGGRFVKRTAVFTFDSDGKGKILIG